MLLIHEGVVHVLSSTRFIFPTLYQKTNQRSEAKDPETTEALADTKMEYIRCEVVLLQERGPRGLFLRLRCRLNFGLHCYILLHNQNLSPSLTI